MNWRQTSLSWKTTPAAKQTGAKKRMSLKISPGGKTPNDKESRSESSTSAANIII